MLSLLVAIFLVLFILFHTESTATAAPSLRGTSDTASTSDAYTAKASSYDTFRAPSPGWNAIQQALKTVPSELVILDLGCGSGAFLSELIALHPSILEAVDRNLAMINIATRKVPTMSAISPSTRIDIRQEKHRILCTGAAESHPQSFRSSSSKTVFHEANPQNLEAGWESHCDDKSDKSRKRGPLQSPILVCRPCYSSRSGAHHGANGAS